MEKQEFLEKILSFGPDWKVVDVVINTAMKEVDIFLEYKNSSSGNPVKIYDYSIMRRYRHLDLFEYTTYINARIPRILDSKGGVKQIGLAWASPKVGYTHLFENKVIEVLKMSNNQTKTALFFNTTFSIVHGIMERAVARGLSKRDLSDLRAISLDEKSYSSGHNYMTVLSDPIMKCVIDIIDGRKEENASELLAWNISPKQAENISVVTMDMWKPFMNATKEILPGAQIVHDNFHVAKYLNDGVNNTRKQEVKKEDVLKQKKYLFLKNRSTWSPYETANFTTINEINLNTSKAWRMKENFKGIYLQATHTGCISYFKDWYTQVINEDIKPMISVADTILRHLEGIINAVLTDMSNSIAECLNGKIQILKSVGRGFRNIDGYRNAILFFNGNLKMYHS
jgi:transposase